MARSSKYDGWDDAGMAVSDEQLAAFTLEEWCVDLVGLLTGQVRVLLRRAEIPNVSKPVWTNKAAKVLQDKTTWLVVASGLPAVDLDVLHTLPDPKAAEGKTLTGAAQALEPVDWLAELRASVSGQLRLMVTMERRKSGATKAERSRANKVANASEGVLNGIEHLEGLLASLPKDADGK